MINKKTVAIAIATVVCVSLLSGAVTYFVANNYYEGLLAEAHPIFVPSTPYKLLHPILGFAFPGDQFDNGFPDVRGGVQSIISGEPAGTVTGYAFYMRELNSGDWTGINQNTPFDPASLLKVVVAIAAYRQAEDNPSYLSIPLTYTADLAQINAQLPFDLPSQLKVGQSYSVESLIKRELANSDNGAVYTLLSSISDQELNSVYQELSIPPPNEMDSVGYKLTTLEYSRFFRILYNGTLSLTWGDSEKILEYLTQSDFVSGLVAGVPAGVSVAHKYGEHVIGSNGVATGVELSDCGIVYYTPQPYFICVMIQGKDQVMLASVIAQISKYTYQQIGGSK